MTLVTRTSLLALGLAALGGFTARGDDAPGASSPMRGHLLRVPFSGTNPVHPVGEFNLQGRWLGQDRHDHVGDPSKLAPNGVQDVHLALGGLPPRREVVRGWIRGYGSGEWQINQAKNNYGAVLIRKPQAMTADVFFEPDRVETGRSFDVKLEFDDGSFGVVSIRGGKADPNLRMPEAAMAARWVGQERFDVAGSGPSVGPDGLQDARIALSRLSRNDKVRSVQVEVPKGPRWVFGSNPDGHHNAEFVADGKDPAQGSLYFQPEADLSGRNLKVTVTYETGKSDTAEVTAGRTDPKLAMPKLPLSPLARLTLQARWLGQDGTASTGPGDVHVAVSGVPPARALAAAVLSDGVRGNWVFRSGDRVNVDAEPGSLPLALKRGGDRGSVDLAFPPVRNEAGATMTLRLVFQDGEMAFGTFAGGACDPFLRGPRPEAVETSARPGDDLNALAARGGTIRLAAGTYDLTRPLVLPRPVTIVGETGTTLMFRQAAGEAPWTSAVKIHAGGTTLRGFAVRFAGPTRWKTDVNWGAAVIGTTDNLDNLPDNPKPALVFESLDLAGPPSSKSSGWEDALKLMRLKDAPCGRVVGCTLRGGVVETFDGPWVFEGNTFNGTEPGTHSPSVFAVHDPHDVVVRKNVARSVAPAGKTWRFLVFTNHGFADRVEGNRIEGIGPRDDDTIPSMNAPEIVLTESYRLWFEGRPAAVSPDGRVVRLVRLPGEAPRTGEVVAVLSGGGAGQYRRIAQRIEPSILLLEEPLPKGADVLAVSPGFVNEVFEGNTIDARWGREAAGFVLAGNHYGTRVAGNRVSGAGEAFRIMAAPSEAPNIWGWSHAPYLGGKFEGNTIEDAELGASFAVQHGGPSKSNRGRVYMTVNLKGNTVRWTDDFLKRREAGKTRAPLAGIVVGSVPVIDPGELWLETVGDVLDAPAKASRATAIVVHGATVNGRAYGKTSFSLPAPSTPAVGTGPTGMRGAGGASPRR